MAWPDVSCRALALLYLRIELTDRNAQLRARFEHLSTCPYQSQVLIIGSLDQAVEHRVVEHLPPIPIFLISRIDRGVACFEPLVRNGSRRLGENRTDHTTGA